MQHLQPKIYQNEPRFVKNNDNNLETIKLNEMIVYLLILEVPGYVGELDGWHEGGRLQPADENLPGYLLTQVGIAADHVGQHVGVAGQVHGQQRGDDAAKAVVHSPARVLVYHAHKKRHVVCAETCADLRQGAEFVDFAHVGGRVDVGLLVQRAGEDARFGQPTRLASVEFERVHLDKSQTWNMHLILKIIFVENKRLSGFADIFIYKFLDVLSNTIKSRQSFWSKSKLKKFCKLYICIFCI